AKEAQMGSFVKLREELNTIENIRTSVKKALAEMDQEETETINLTDSDCKKMKGRQGTHAAYNAQIVVDEKHGLIVSNDVVNDANDLNQFSEQINAANEILEQNCQNACGDAGYSNVGDLKNIVDQDINVVVPNQRQALHKTEQYTGFEKENFQYIKNENCYLCPAGNKLKYNYYNKKKGHYLYRMSSTKNCLKCQHFGICTNNPRGRSIIRLKNEELKEKLAVKYTSLIGQKIYAKRKEKVELVFGHIKHNLKASSFLLRGFDGVKSEMAVLSTVFNIRRMISLLGTKKLIEAIAMLNNPSTLLFKFSHLFMGFSSNPIRPFY
ncbi:MAG: transposase, partial [Candidatus Margulisiibacteriota bacterium]